MVLKMTKNDQKLMFFRDLEKALKSALQGNSITERGIPKKSQPLVDEILPPFESLALFGPPLKLGPQN